MVNHTKLFLRSFQSFTYMSCAILLIFSLMVNSTDLNDNDIDNNNNNSFDLDSKSKELVWCGPAKEILFVLTENNSLYRSDDKGASFKNLNDVMIKAADYELGIDKSLNEVGKVDKILLSPVDKNLIIFKGTHGINWISQDCGKLIDAQNHGRKIEEFIFHPTERNWILASAYTLCDDFYNEPCRKFLEIYVSKDLGNSWNLLLPYVVQFDWGITSNKHISNGIPKERILASYEKDGKGDQKIDAFNSNTDFVYSDNFFKTKIVAANKGNKFLLTDSYLYVAQVSNQELKEVSLLVSDSNLKIYNFEPIIHDQNKKFLEYLEESKNFNFVNLKEVLDVNNYNTLSRE